MQLNDLVAAPDGTLYVADSGGSTLFRKKPNEQALSVFGKRGAFRGANGIAMARDGGLYVAVSSGIVRVDTATGEPTRLSQPDSVATGAIDGLYWYDGDLIGVQNVTNPGRVVRIALGDKGGKIIGLTVLQSHHHPDFDEPTTGAIAHNTLYVLGNASVGHYQPDGTITNPGDLKGCAIIAVPLQR
jgi:sugar lactone lactonase YvrE